MLRLSVGVALAFPWACCLYIIFGLCVHTDPNPVDRRSQFIRLMQLILASRLLKINLKYTASIPWGIKKSSPHCPRVSSACNAVQLVNLNQSLSHTITLLSHLSLDKENKGPTFVRAQICNVHDRSDLRTGGHLKIASALLWNCSTGCQSQLSVPYCTVKFLTCEHMSCRKDYSGQRTYPLCLLMALVRNQWARQK